MCSCLMAGWELANPSEHNVKQYYRGAEVEKLVYDSHPFMELVPKDEKFRGVNAP